MGDSRYVLWFDELRMTDVSSVGGKECIAGRNDQPIVSGGSSGSRRFCNDRRCLSRFSGSRQAWRSASKQMLAGWILEMSRHWPRLARRSAAWIVETPLPPRLEKEISAAYEKMLREAEISDISVAVRSSATAEDLADASFAGQQETFLNIHGLDNLLKAVKDGVCFALQ